MSQINHQEQNIANSASLVATLDRSDIGIFLQNGSNRDIQNLFVQQQELEAKQQQTLSSAQRQIRNQDKYEDLNKNIELKWAKNPKNPKTRRHYLIAQKK
eukprot:403370859